ncbi:Phosphotransferase enzyme family protein [Thalassoglobus neptunius]|uniref:Phosphotransferase enzyme family protein n=1 Tax=Thalassoglobus neptunius TaxID=1938619 RepID=A0A5C5WNB8_9PLAN|nr:bifunctional aminoglycoside phosphotransferase/ATP-binding protein [Thalassoglobus neptunius]TWT51685.1 Phosphotransferase enzyme family protein [Thalassoglobus neptunius]
MEIESQEELGPSLLRQLKESGSFGGGDCDLIETHISWVVLAGNRGWKIKKPVDLGFADFSTLELRKHFCEEELRLNSRLAPEIYRRVVPITGTVDQPQFDGSGEIIDYAVEMQRFPVGRILSEMIGTTQVENRHFETLAEDVAEFHQSVSTAPADSRFGSPEKVWTPVAENFEQLKLRISEEHSLKVLARVEQEAEREWQTLEKLVSLRKQEGFIRECHGDMHLGNMVLLNDRIRIFDGIDFNEELRWIDVICEVAFVVMDLEHRGMSHEAVLFLNKYCEETGDYHGLRLLSFYASYLAMVRAKVAAIRRTQQSEDDQEPDRKEILPLMELASSYFHDRPRKLILTFGLSGSGKSYFSQHLVGPLRVIRLRSDVERNRLNEAKQLGENVYSSESKEEVYRHLRRCAESVLRGGMSVIVDATFLDPEQRKPFFELASEMGCELVILQFDAPGSILKKRVAQRQQDGNDASEADLSVLEKQQREFQPLSETESPFAVRVDTTLDRKDCVEKVVSEIHRGG